MSTTILCQVARAENPYYLEDVDMHIGSIEELCYYLQNHLPLVDLSFFSMHLLDWIEGELGAVRLAQNLYRILTEVPDPKLLDLILPVMQEAGWLNAAEERAMREELRTIDEQPVAVRMKQKADMLVSYRKYTRAIRTYELILTMKQTEKLGSAFAGSVSHNMGVVYAKLFQMEEASACMKQAFELLHTGQVLHDYLFCVRCSEGEEAYEELAGKLGVDQAMRDTLDGEMEAIDSRDEPEDVDETLRGWVQEYHRETGL